MKTMLAIAGLACMLTVSPSSAQTAGSGALRPGDKIRITVFRNPEMSGEFAILSDGSVGHPLYRTMHVSGVPLQAVQDSVRKFLSVGFNVTPDFVIEPLYRVVVAGEVRAPSIYAVPPTTSIAEAIAIAGGVSSTGDMQKVRFQRGGSLQIIDLTDPSTTAVANGPIQSGDQFLVERKRSVFRDVIAPAASLTAAVVSILNFVITQTKN